MSPGPDFAIVSRQALLHGRSAGLWTAWGIASGIVAHVALGLFGLGWLLERLPSLLEWLRYGGAAFLIWMGYGSWRASSTPGSETAVNAAPAPRRSYLLGVATNLLNPKAALFCAALFSATLTAGAPASLNILLGAWIILSTGTWFSLISLAIAHPRIRQHLLSRARLIDRAMAVLLVSLALLLLFSP
nr:LysE family transporter [Solimonas sp. SE-A11]